MTIDDFNNQSEKVSANVGSHCLLCQKPFKVTDKVIQLLSGTYEVLDDDDVEYGMKEACVQEFHAKCFNKFANMVPKEN